MNIKCWGSRGSIPVSGVDYIKYGGDTTCIEILTKDNQIIIVDAGTGIRRLGNQLIKDGKKSFHFLLTHAHWDHLIGFPFFKPLFQAGHEIHMHQGHFHKDFMEKIFSKVMAPPNFPVQFSDLKANIIYEKCNSGNFTIGSVTVTPIAISHPNKGNGYKFTEDGKSFIFVPDNELDYIHKGGLAFDEYVKFCQGADLLFHDAEFTPDEYKTTKKWGHSSYTTALDLALKANVKEFGLFHLNQERIDSEVDAIILDCHKIIAARGADLKCYAVGSNMTFEL